MASHTSHGESYKSWQVIQVIMMSHGKSKKSLQEQVMVIYIGHGIHASHVK